MAWQQLIFDLTPERAEPLSELLSEAGAASVTFLDCVDTPIYEPAPDASDLWEQTRVVGLFDADADIDTVLAQIKQAPDFSTLPPYRLCELKEQQWERVWMDRFQPICFGKQLWICPTETAPPDPEAINIMLDPGLAFGTGTHPTTALCLEWIDGHTLKEKSVIDYGCGSGVLAIAAALSGAAPIHAVDIDPQALLATRNNSAQNDVAAQISTALPDEARDKLTPVDCLLANILANPLTELAEYFSTLVKHNGIIVLSGILSEQASRVIDAYRPWFAFEPVCEKEGWVRLVATRNDS